MNDTTSKCMIRADKELLIYGILLIVSGMAILFVFRFSLLPQMIILLSIIYGIWRIIIFISLYYVIEGDEIRIHSGFRTFISIADDIGEISVRRQYNYLDDAYSKLLFKSSNGRILLNGRHIDLTKVWEFINNQEIATSWDEEYVLWGNPGNIITDEIRRLCSYRVYQGNTILRPGLIISAVLCIIGTVADITIAGWIMIIVLLFAIWAYLYFNGLYMTEAYIGNKEWNAWKHVGMQTNFKMIFAHSIILIYSFAILLHRFSEIAVIDYGGEWEALLWFCMTLVYAGLFRFTTDCENSDLGGILGIATMFMVCITCYLYIPCLFSYEIGITGEYIKLDDGSPGLRFVYENIKYEFPTRISLSSLFDANSIPIKIHISPLGRVCAYVKGGFNIDHHILRDFLEA